MPKQIKNRDRGRVVAVQLTLDQTRNLYTVSDALYTRPAALCRRWVLCGLRDEFTKLEKSGDVVSGFVQENLFRKGVKK